MTLTIISVEVITEKIKSNLGTLLESHGFLDNSAAHGTFLRAAGRFLVLLDLPQLGLDIGQLGVQLVQLVLQTPLVLDPTGASLSQEVNLYLDSEGSTWRQEISNNTTGVRDALPPSPTMLGIEDPSDSFEGLENFALPTKENEF